MLYLQVGIYNYVNLYAPDVVVIGGGADMGLAPYVSTMRSAAFLPPYPGYQFNILCTTLHEIAGILGSAAPFSQIKVMARCWYCPVCLFL